MRPGPTTSRTIRRGGTHGRFALLEEGPGEHHRSRADLVAGPDSDAGDERPVLFRILHVTDFQIADLSSPARVEYLEHLRGDPRWALMLPSYRPQEFTALAQVEAMARTIRDLAHTGREVDLVITTGDNTDSQQHNELADFLAVMAGDRTVHPLGDHGGAGVVSAHAAAGGEHPAWALPPDTPRHPGAVPDWSAPFVASGMGVPWIACYGNHDALVQGRARTTGEVENLLVGAAKPTGPAGPDDWERVHEAAGADRAIDAYVRDPMCFTVGATGPVPADVRRRTFERGEFVTALREAGALAPAAEPGETRAYASYQPHPALKVLMLDTTNPGGYADGSIGAEQLRWLVDELVTAHSRYLAEDGGWVDTEHSDQLVVLCSHHGLSTLTNSYVQLDRDGDPLPGQDLPRTVAPELEAVLHRFPNVVLWLSGHIHRNRVQAVRTATGGFWEVATSAMIDWPNQARFVDFSLHDDVLRIRCEQVDHLAAIDPEAEPDRVLRMASIGRRLAANVHDGVGGPHAEGTPLDRNVDLLVPVTKSLAERLREG
ncbi:metallophosphoesterase [Pseudonocardia spinosispora]|uniref:metallophosphoesterase n=1 Tax=Pseudonocardia spinosispora TaxID=103441 RepID=UPI00048AD184|nr:metallophosphoesterase [Pseudonocardia spinosispora]